jgi:hypothetical protein
MIITSSQLEKIYASLGLDALSPLMREAIINRFGHDILTKAVGNFLAEQGEWEQAAFETWVEEHANEDTMLEQMVTLYPGFGRCLVTEILDFKKVFAESNS